MAKENRKIFIITVALIGLIISISTALAVSEPKINALPVEVIDSDKVIFKNVRIVDKDGLQVKGFVKPQRNQLVGIVSGHVDVELLDGSGRTLEKGRASHTPTILRTKGNKRSYFTYILGTEAKNCSAVRVSYHYTRNAREKQCSSG